MAVYSISLASLAPSSEQGRAWCAWLEEGGILYFPETPVPIPAADLEFLLSRQQTYSKLHKNIAYKPNLDRLSGLERGASDTKVAGRLHAIMHYYSASVSEFLTRFLAPYDGRWRLDFASYRPFEEEGRNLPLRRRNDLIHTDAFPTRPTRGARILRFFNNINPSETRNWVVGEPFARIVDAFAPSKLTLPRAAGLLGRVGCRIACTAGLGALVPRWKRTPYDEFMMQLHNAMKEDAGFQASCTKEFVKFAPGSSWMVYTETVPHAVLSGQYALEQTFLVDPAAMVRPESAPVAVLEKMAGARLT